jgi:Ser/Thr protein kinase RdoA (MazF antagonist)
MMAGTILHASMVQDFFTLTPDRVLEAVEQAGHPTTGGCWALGSLENRVYEIELDDRSRVVAKFYRPGRWSEQTILDEHRLLGALVEAELPACAPIAFTGGETLRATPEGIFFAIFPRVGGRSPDELAAADLAQIGRLLARIHNVAAACRLTHRPALSPATYGTDALAQITRSAELGAVRASYEDAVRRVVEIAERRWEGAATQIIHADCHRGNLMRGRAGWSFLDFDDMAVGPPVQDVWLLLPARPPACRPELDALLDGYEEFRDFDRSTLRLVEPLRALRYVRYAAWIAARWEDPSFSRAFPTFGTPVYWEGQLADLREQLGQMED